MNPNVCHGFSGQVAFWGISLIWLSWLRRGMDIERMVYLPKRPGSKTQSPAKGAESVFVL